MQQKRAQFATRLGVIATTVGSAVGLGNIWRFPYEAGSNGGGAFMALYILFIVILGIPVIVAEFTLGRESRSNVFGAFNSLKSSGKWHWLGYIGIIASLMILSFYSVVAGWTVEYFGQSVGGALTEDGDLHRRFVDFTSGWRCVMWTVVFLLINHMVIIRGVQKGIEKISNIMMPILFLILLVFCINSLLLPGAAEGLKFLFNPDFSKITTGVVLGALGQAFFSLSIGLGCMMTYASYFKEDVNIVKSAGTIASLDTLVAVLAGIMIFPAVFTYGFEPQGGPTLVFEVLPNIFSRMTGGGVWSILFFLMLFLASLSSTISMSEIAITFFCEQWHMSRRNACRLTTGIAMVLGVLCALSFGLVDLKFNFFDFFNDFSSNILLPFGGMMIAIFVGWFLDRKVLRKQLSNEGRHNVRLYRALVFCIKFIAPIGLFIILIMCAIKWIFG